MTTRRDHVIEVGVRPDGAAWRIPLVELQGDEPGPSTVFVAGVWGDKPLAVMTLWALVDELRQGALKGTVWVIPAANPPAIAAGTRVNPDGVALNRVFPGASTGTLTMQVAHALFTEIMSRADCVVDIHSGTPTMGLGYIYDYGDLELSASFGYLPVVPGFAQPGQLSQAVVAAGGTSCLVEFGGGHDRDIGRWLAGCLNIAAHRGHINREPTGFASVPLIERVAMFLPSHAGILGSHLDTSMLGTTVPAGPAAWIDCPGTGERLETFEVDAGGMLLLVNTTPLLVEPGSFGLTVGFHQRSITVPGHR